jgi:hypothetical protein
VLLDFVEAEDPTQVTMLVTILAGGRREMQGAWTASQKF